MNVVAIKVVAKHALIIGALAAGATIVRDTFILTVKK